ncbi:MAG: tRNA(1-methyladenosine) methyltransferase-like methyltransferase [Dehalococcoidia bacterium]|nr:tRNA(1-methyladenosine) methyltransferase-like methyltransferase [Dehalococcoidia bacterium]
MVRQPRRRKAYPRNRFAEGDHALLIDRRGRRYFISLSAEKSFHTHLGVVPHADIIGQEIGARVHTATGHELLALSPTLGDFVQEMPHPTQVVYAKDLGAILMYGDIFPGAVVLEAGLGSGALTMALLRAVGVKGRVISYEVRPEFVEKARKNIETLNPDPKNLEIKIKDVYQGIDETGLDRIVLDVPEPWHVVPAAAQALVPGGVFLSFLPTVLQIHHLQEALWESRHFDLMETIEVLVRPWSVTRRSVRPVHRMVAHTGFITIARRCALREGPGWDEDEPGVSRGPEVEGDGVPGEMGLSPGG